MERPALARLMALLKGDVPRLFDAELLSQLGVAPVAPVPTAQHVFTFPALTPEACLLLIQAAEEADVWASAANDPYPGRETRLVRIDPGLDELFRKLWALVANRVLASHYPKYQIHWSTVSSPFLIRQEVGDPGMDLHYDEVSNVTFSLPLSDGWQGEGLRFPFRPDLPDNAADGFRGPLGHCLCFPGGPTHFHEVPPITSGLRYSLTIWTRGV